MNRVDFPGSSPRSSAWPVADARAAQQGASIPMGAEPLVICKVF